MRKALFNPLSPQYRADPYPLLHTLRSVDPVHHDPTIDCWVLTRHDDVLAALKHPSLSSDLSQSVFFRRNFFRGDHGSYGEANQVIRRWLLVIDPPAHTRLRQLLSRAFTPRVIDNHRPRIEAIADELIEGIEVDADDEVDVIEAFAGPFPVLVIGDLLGVPARHTSDLLKWSEALYPCLGPPISRDALTDANAAMSELTALFRDIVRERREPGADRNDLISRLIDARDVDDRLSEDEMIANIILLMFAGHLTTVQLIASGLLALRAHPDQLALLRSDLSRIGDFVTETLRYAPPLQLIYRVATAPVSFRGKEIPAGAFVVLSLAAANRDPSVFPDPDRFDIERKAKHLAFGHGMHYCLGAALGRLEAEVAVPRLLARFPQLRLRDEAPEREPSLMLRAVKHLLIRDEAHSAQAVECEVM